MISIKDRKILGQIFSHYDYVMTTAQLSKEKLYYRDVQRMLEAGLIERIKRGYYHWAAGSGKGDVVIISRLFPDGILCMETALFYYGYSDRNPAEWNIAIDKNASRQRTRIDYPSIKAYRLEPALLSIGVTRGEINFTDVRIYDRDRTICDVLRTPDFLSHEKKYNRGQEEFVIIKDHHEPIISRELFDEANRILDAKSLSQEGKAKHSNRYPFSGKIKCGCCGSSYVARYKTRKDGSRYKAWRCNEAAKHGSPHIDKAGNQVGCTGLSIRNEDATHIMYLVTKSLKYNRNKIINNLTAVIQSIIAMDTTGTDVLKLQEQIKKIEGKRANLIDLYMSNLINKDEFTATRASCDAEIEELQSIIESVDKQREMIEQQQQLLKEIEDAIKEIVSGVEYEDEFYKHILDKMVVQDKDNIDVYLNLLPMKWSYTVAKASKKAVASEWNISEASLPMSVSRAFSSG